MSDCDRFESLISEYVDGELLEPQKTELENHMRQCAHCRRLCDAFRSISLSLGEEAAPAGFAEDVMAAVRTRGESGATRDKKPGKSWPKYLALAACLALAVLTTVRLSLPSGTTGQAPPEAQAAQFGLAAVPKEFDSERSADSDAGEITDSVNDASVSAQDSDGSAYAPTPIEAPEDIVRLSISGELEAVLTDADSIATVAGILSYGDEAASLDTSAEASCQVSVEYDDGFEILSVWISGDELFCASEGGDAYEALGSPAELMDALGQ